MYDVNKFTFNADNRVLGVLSNDIDDMVISPMKRAATKIPVGEPSLKDRMIAMQKQ